MLGFFFSGKEKSLGFLSVSLICFFPVLWSPQQMCRGRHDCSHVTDVDYEAQRGQERTVNRTPFLVYADISDVTQPCGDGFCLCLMPSGTRFTDSLVRISYG